MLQKLKKINKIKEQIQFTRQEKNIINSIETKSMFEYLQILKTKTVEARNDEERLIKIARTKVLNLNKENKNAYNLKIDSEVIKLKEQYDKKIESIEHVMISYSKWGNISDQIKEMTNTEKINLYKQYYDVKNISMDKTWNEINKLEQDLIKTKENKQESLIIESLESSIKRSKDYAINIETKGEYFKINNKILITKENKNLEEKEKNKILEDLILQKEKYQKLDVTETEKKVINNLKSIITKYKKQKQQKTAEINSKLNDFYQDVKVASISIKNLKNELNLEKENQKNKIVIPINNASKIYSGLGKVNKIKRKGDSLTDSMTDKIDGIEND